ncbi:hypothetical protein GCM10010873_21020 [Cypionkella aquatica]|uniref:Uncharacterized protein n=1 Tax=Cypionkella aquatica TaxID=1756042 RepID=A0AA37TWF9_9RHOB|nr:hypothetical protein GCM10010873_21020 [Cypionkella aquatica]
MFGDGIVAIHFEVDLHLRPKGCQQGRANQTAGGFGSGSDMAVGIGHLGFQRMNGVND